MKTFIVLVKSDYIRDAQIYVGNRFDNPPDDEIHWKDLTPTHYVGIFKGADEEDVVLEASEMTGFPSEILEAIEMI